MYNGLVISDIHFGATDPKQLKYELSEGFLKYIDNMKQLDFIIITGDYFDHKLYLNDTVSDYAVAFMGVLIRISKERNCPIRIVYGTDSHEVNQYTIFNEYENNPDIDFKVIKTVSDEELLPNLHVLYVPEEYVYSKQEYYSKYLSGDKKYNYIFGHGTINDIMTYITDSGKTDRKRVAVFSSSELLDVCEGEVYFGHYHIHSNIDERLFYVGSYSRWQHGEDEPKGFYHISYDSDKDKYKHHFIENPYAKKYVTITYGYNSEAIQSEENLIKELSKRDEIIDSTDADYVRYIFNIPETHENPEFIIKILNERYKFNDDIKFKVVNGYVEKKKKINKQRLHEVLNEYPFIFDKSEKFENKVMYFIKKRYEYDISCDSVREILYDENEEV